MLCFRFGGGGESEGGDDGNNDDSDDDADANVALSCHDSWLPRLWASAPSVSATESNAGSFRALQNQNREQRTLQKQNRELRKRLHRAQKTRYMGGREYNLNKDE